MPYRPISATFRERAATIRPSAIRCNIDPSCIACAVFFLLIIFMLQPPPPHGALSLPRVANAAPVPTAAKDDSLYVFILRDGTAFFRGAKLSPIDLHPKLREALSESSKRRVYLSVDVRARYRAVKQVLDEISAAGIQSVCFLGNRPTTPPMLQSPHD